MDDPVRPVPPSASVGNGSSQPKPCVLCCPAGALNGLDSLNADLRPIGLEFVAAIGPAPDEVAADLLSARGRRDGGKTQFLVYYTYMAAPRRPLVSAANAGLLRKISTTTRRHGVRGLLLNDDIARRVGERWPALGEVVSRASEGDRDLTLSPGEEFIRDLSQNRLRSTVWLVRRNGELLVRKAFSARYAAYFQNELTARRVVKDDRIVAVAMASGTVIYLPYLRDYQSWRDGFFSFFPQDCAREVFDLIARVNRQGYSIIDINPDTFLYKDGAVKAVDMEFFSPTWPASRIEESADYTGEFKGIESPRKGGYDRHWRDVVGAPYHVIAGGSRTALWCWRALHIVFYRAPQRLGLAAERGVRWMRDLVSYAYRVRGGVARMG